MEKKQKYLHNCKVCGFQYDNDEFPYGEDMKTPNYEMCPCCNTQHGYEDCTEIAVIKYRRNWINSGAKWQQIKIKPENWDYKIQLKNIGL